MVDALAAALYAFNLSNTLGDGMVLQRTATTVSRNGSTGRPVFVSYAFIIGTGPHA